jgi:S-(hydroxymethyl)glutathione dehydrogenase / alcohol dehydrogenase
MGDPLPRAAWRGIGARVNDPLQQRDGLGEDALLVLGELAGQAFGEPVLPLYSRLYLDGRFELDALVSAEISLDQIESGYQQLADPDVSRVVITRF